MTAPAAKPTPDRETEPDPGPSLLTLYELLGAHRFAVVALLHVISLFTAGAAFWALLALEWGVATSRLETSMLALALRLLIIQGARITRLERDGLKLDVRAEFIPGPGFRLVPGGAKPAPPSGGRPN